MDPDVEIAGIMRRGKSVFYVENSSFTMSLSCRNTDSGKLKISAWVLILAELVVG